VKYVNAIVLPTILIGVILYFSYHALAGEQGLAHWTRLQAQEDDLRHELVKVQADRDALKVSIARLKDDTLDLDYVEEIARTKLSYARADELLVATR
jgi:cell division protein FtsB